MATTKKYFTRVPNGGFNRAFESHMHKPEEAFDLLQLRPVVGAMKQLPLILLKQAYSLLAGESGVTPTHFLDLVFEPTAVFAYLMLNESNARYISVSNLSTQTLIPTVLNIAVPQRTDIHGQCLLGGYNATDFSATNDQIDVQIVTDDHHFQWRRNGGSWSSALLVTGVTNIGTHGLQVFFMVDSNFVGYTIGDTWSWRRVDNIPYDASVASTEYFKYSSTMFLTDQYFGGIGRNIMRVRDGFITTVGYVRTYGKYVAVYANHLIVGQGAMGVYDAIAGVVDGYVPATTPYNLMWSQLNDPDQFFGTDNNEADSYLVPYNSYPDFAWLGITGMELLGGYLYIYLPDAMYYMTYVGLPQVMQVLPAWGFVGSIFPSGLVNTKRGHYFISRDNFYFFIGLRPNPIGEPVREKFFAEIVPPTDAYWQRTFGFYDNVLQEVVWTYWTKSGSTYQARQVVFMEKYNRWYFRNVPSADSGSTNLTTICRTFVDQTRLMYGGLGNQYMDFLPADSGTPETDLVGSPNAYTAPMIETNDLYYQDIYVQKEADGMYIDAGWASGIDGVKLSTAQRQQLNADVSYTDGAALWTPSLPEGKLGTPRVNGRILRFRFTFMVTSGQWPQGAKLSAWGDMVYNKGAER